MLWLPSTVFIVEGSHFCQSPYQMFINGFEVAWIFSKIVFFWLGPIEVNAAVGRTSRETKAAVTRKPRKKAVSREACYLLLLNKRFR